MKINLYDWCKNNNPKLIDEWDQELNGKDMSFYTYKSGKYAYWTCHDCKHKWSSKICNRTNGSGCPSCANRKNGQRVIDLQIKKNGSLKDSGLPCMEDWDYDKNDIDPANVAIFSNKNVWWKCKLCRHEWKTSPNSRAKGRGCPVCNSSLANQKKIALHLARDGSFADNYPEFVKYWDFDLNDKSCYELTSNSTYVANWRCFDCGCRWIRSLVHMAHSKGCPRCVEAQEISSIQRKTQEYLLSAYQYDLRHEKDCSIIPKNPRTNYPMPYDNELVISKENRLFIEVNGEQHYHITEFVKKDAKKRGVSPQEELEYIQWKDEYKKQYVLDNGCYYLALSYLTFQDNSYKTLIDNKIQEILNNPTLTCAS